MTPEAQRIAIATACGWTDIEHRPFAATVHEESQPSGWFGRRAGMMHTALPDFLADLNAMHAAEKVLDDEQYHGPFTVHLLDLLAETSHMAPVPTAGGSTILMPTSIPRWNSATAAERAEAFLRALGKWTDAK